MKKSASLVFFGNERLSSGFSPNGAPTLERLIAEGYHIHAVVAHYEAGSSRKARALEIEAVARAHNIPVLLPHKLADIREQLESYQADAGVLVAYGKIIPQSIIDIFPHGILNIHPSLLPLHRGPTPIEQAILDGAGETGVSIMGLVKQMDAGPIFAQKRIQLTGTESKIDLTAQLLELGSQMITDVLQDVLSGTAKPTSQDESRATFTNLIKKSDGIIDLSRPAIQIERSVRAYAGWPKSKIEIFGNTITVTKARIAADADDGDLVVACNPGWLEIQEVVAPSGKTMKGADFLRGYRK